MQLSSAGHIFIRPSKTRTGTEYFQTLKFLQFLFKCLDVAVGTCVVSVHSVRHTGRGETGPRSAEGDLADGQRSVP